MITVIKDFKIKKSYSDLISKKLIKYLTEFIYKPLYGVIGEKPKAINSITPEDAIINALKAGIIYYNNGEFKAKNKFSNKISMILEKWGAKFNKFKKSYKIDPDKIPANVLQENARQKIEYEAKLKEIDSLLNEMQTNLSGYVERMVFDDEVITVLDDAGEEVKKKVKKITVIEPELNINQKKEIAKNYTNNIQFYIKDFEEKKIPDMRQKIQDLTLKGYRPDAISEMLQKEYGFAQKKADFLAQNETSIMLAEYKKVTYQKMGFQKFRWSTIMDGKERERHKELNGKIFSYDNPPVIDEYGNRGLPGQTYNCRCEAIPIMDNNPLSDRKYSYIDEQGEIKTKKMKDVRKNPDVA